MKHIYAILGLLAFGGFAWRLFNLETMQDMGMLIAWAVAILINHISYKHEKE